MDSVSHSFLLELKTAISDSIRTFSYTLPPTIVYQYNFLIHFCWDNFDLLENTPSGAGTTHSTHGIVIQELTGAQYTPQEGITRMVELVPDALEGKDGAQGPPGPYGQAGPPRAEEEECPTCGAVIISCPLRKNKFQLISTAPI